MSNRRSNKAKANRVQPFIGPKRGGSSLLIVALVTSPFSSSAHAGQLGHYDREALLQLPAIPDWALHTTTVVPTALSNPSISASNCPPLFGFPLANADIVAPRFDAASGKSQFYSGECANNRILRYDVDASLNLTITPLPIPYGIPWVAQDLDLDGNMELVVQRGDAGFGGDGYLDILSAPSWTLRRRFTFPGMKVYMHAAAVNVDADPELELFVTPADFYSSRAVLIDFDSDSGAFVKTSDISAPTGSNGQPAIADFDSDGRIEFLVGGYQGYGLFECDGSALRYIGQIGDTTAWNNTHAVAARVKPDGMIYALLGHSTGSPDTMGFYYELMKPAGDNAFERVYTFREPLHNAVGIDPCFAADVDCDGLDEMIMMFSPTQYTVTEEWEWDDIAGDFVQRCVWDWNSLGTPVRFWNVDLNQDGVGEWGIVNHLYEFHSYADSCIACTNAGRCPFPGPWCNCPCYGDPHCDGQVNILDVVETIGVAFRGTSPSYDSMCPRDRTDVDCSGVTDILDVVKSVNVAFRAGDPATEFCLPCTK